MRFLVIGAGAIGTYLGVSLAHSGHEVTFLVRPATAAYLRAHGLSLRQKDEVWRLPRPQTALSVPEALAAGPYDAALLALKTYHTAGFLRALTGQEDAFPPVVCLQNGVDAEARLSQVLEPAKVLAATVTTAVARRSKHEAEVSKARGVGLAAGGPLSRKLAAAFHQAGLRPRLYPHAAAMKWSKLLTNLLSNATSAILDLPPGAIYDHPGLLRLEVRQMQEALAVMAAQNLPVVNLPGAPVRWLAWSVRRLPWPVLRRALPPLLRSGRGDKMPSFHLDLHSGRGQTEVDALHGAVARHGAAWGIPTPVNAFLTQTLHALARGDLPRETFRHKPQALLQALAQSAPAD